MTRILRLPLLLPALFLALVAVWTAVPSVAYAQDVAVSAPAPVNLTKLVLLLCAAVPFLVRTLTSNEKWPHTAWGAAALAFVSSLGATLYSYLQTHTFSLAALEMAGYGAALGLLGAANGSNIGNAAATLAARGRKVAVALLLLPVFTVAACGCFTQSNPKYATKTCVEVRKVLDCTANIALDIVSIAGPAIAAGLIAGSGFDVGALASAAEQEAPGGGVCLLGSIEAALPQPGTTSALPAALVAAKFKVHGAAVAHARKVYNLSAPLDVKVRKADGTIATVTVEPGSAS